MTIHHVKAPVAFGELLVKWLCMAIVLLGLFFTSIPLSHGAIDVYEFDNERQEAQYRGLIEELRCPKCQNQNLAGSDAPIAQDLKQKVYDMVKEGRSDAEIRQYMFERYGDFISYKPPVRPSTWILWFFPPTLLVLILIGWLWRTKRRQSLIQTTSLHAADTNAADGLSAKEQAALEALLASHPDNHPKNCPDNKQADELANTGDKS